MKIGIIDAEIIGKNKHRFPNLCCMKISSWHKSQGDNVTLLLDYDHIDDYDKVYISKIYIKTNLPNEDKKAVKTETNCADYYCDNDIINMPNVEAGGTGFFFDKAKPLPDNIEHMMPDYNLYDEWIDLMVLNGAKRKDFFWYTDYSIGYLTRGCFRRCPFCVNKKYSHAWANSPVKEFLDESRKKICFLDDNFFACNDWEQIIDDVKQIGKPFQFKQGLDERLLDEKKIIEIDTWKYDGDITLAFDDYSDKDLIISKLELLYAINPDYKHQLRFYILCGYDRAGRYDEDFWINDLRSVFERCFILSKYSALPYIMRHENYNQSPYRGMYITIARWVNRPSLYKSMSFFKSSCLTGMESNYKEYKDRIDDWIASDLKKGASYRYMKEFADMYPDIADKYFNVVPKSLAQFGCNTK